MKLSHLGHLAKRFVTSLRPGPPATVDESWARGQLGSGEQAIWGRMSNPDRRHAVGVARAVVAEIGPSIERPVVAAALLHDSGKVVSGLRTPARVAATVLWAVLDDDQAAAWAERTDGPLGALQARLGAYRLHPEIGAQLLAEAGADRLTVAWTREHHLPPADWTVPHEIGVVLKACDDD